MKLFWKGPKVASGAHEGFQHRARGPQKEPKIYDLNKLSTAHGPIYIYIKREREREREREMHVCV